MAFILAILASILISVMVAANGELSTSVGIYPATLIANLVGLGTMSVITAVGRQNPFRLRGVSPLLLTGGIIGVATTVFNNLSFGRISVTSIVALSLLGEAITSLTIDRFGLFGMTKCPLNKARVVGIIAAALGIAVMLNFERGTILAIVLSLLTGVTVVTSRVINGRLADRVGAMAGAWHSYAFGSLTAAVVLGVALLLGAERLPTELPGGVWPYMGGAIGGVIVVLLNLSVTKLPSFIMTLIVFSGQVFAGLVIDVILSGAWSWRSFAGGCFALVGLSLNLLLDRKKKSERPSGSVLADADTNQTKQ